MANVLVVDDQEAVRTALKVLLELNGLEALPAGGADEALVIRTEDVGDRAQGVVSRAAARPGVSRQALYRRMERHGIVLEHRPRR